MIISRMLARRIFIAVNNPWICDIDEDPVKVCYDMDYILQEQKLTDRLSLRTDFEAEDRYGTFPMYRMYIHLEAIGKTTAIDIGKIVQADVKDLHLILIIDSYGDRMALSLPTECEDLDSAKYLTKLNDFNIRNVMTVESNNEL